jgi:uncharacterized protein YjbJ (UPF0337 family)
MNKDRVEGKVKDVAGRAERQAGEWTDNPNLQVKGTAKQAEGKVQNAWGKAKDATEKTADDAKASSKPPKRAPDDADAETLDSKEGRRRA